MKKSRAAVILSVISIVFLVLTAIGTVLMHLYMDKDAIKQIVEDNLVVGVLLMLLVCIAQVVVALVPGEMVEMAAGYAFGPISGLLICLEGAALGSALVLYLVRRFGAKFVYVFYPKEKLDALPLLKDSPKRSFLTFILFLIPGTPKDLLTYCIGLTNMSIPKYLVLTTAARIPSIITSTLGGDLIQDRNYIPAIIVFAVTGLISGLGLLGYHLIKKIALDRAHKTIPTNSSTDNSSPHT